MGKKFGVRRIKNCYWEGEEEDATQKVAHIQYQQSETLLQR